MFTGEKLSAVSKRARHFLRKWKLINEGQVPRRGCVVAVVTQTEEATIKLGAGLAGSLHDARPPGPQLILWVKATCCIAFTLEKTEMLCSIPAVPQLSSKSSVAGAGVP